MYKKLEILKFYDIFKLSIANFVYSTLTSDSPAIFDNWFQYDHEVHDHTTRASTNIMRENYFDIGYVEQSFTLHTKGARNNFGRKMIQVTGPIIWNSIPEDIQKVATIYTFKREYKRFIFNEYVGVNDNDNVNYNDNNHNNINNPRRRYNDNQRWRQTVDQPFVSRWDQACQQ